MKDSDRIEVLERKVGALYKILDAYDGLFKQTKDNIDIVKDLISLNRDAINQIMK